MAIAASVAAAAGLVGLVASASAMPPIGDPLNPTFPPAQHKCTQAGGEFGFAGPGAFYACLKSSGFSKGELNGARGLCEGGYRGLFFVDALGGDPNSNYICFAGQG